MLYPGGSNVSSIACWATLAVAPSIDPISPIPDSTGLTSALDESKINM